MLPTLLLLTLVPQAIPVQVGMTFRHNHTAYTIVATVSRPQTAIPKRVCIADRNLGSYRQIGWAFQEMFDDAKVDILYVGEATDRSVCLQTASEIRKGSK